MDIIKANNIKNAALASAALTFYNLIDSLAFEEWMRNLLAFLFWAGVFYLINQWSAKRAPTEHQEALKRDAISAADKRESDLFSAATQEKK